MQRIVKICLSAMALAYTSLGFAEDNLTKISKALAALPAAEQEEVTDWLMHLATYRDLVQKLPTEPDKELVMPVQGVRISQVKDTWGGVRSGNRRHEGADIFAPEGTPIYSATHGYVWEIDQNRLGGNFVAIVGAGGMRYYYAHLQKYAPDLKEGQEVTPNTLIGYVGRTGGAKTTPPHLHLGIYNGFEFWDEVSVYNPYPMLIDRKKWQDKQKV